MTDPVNANDPALRDKLDGYEVLANRLCPGEVSFTLAVTHHDRRQELYARYEQRMESTIHRCLVELAELRSGKLKAASGESLPISPYVMPIAFESMVAYPEESDLPDDGDEGDDGEEGACGSNSSESREPSQSAGDGAAPTDAPPAPSAASAQYKATAEKSPANLPVDEGYDASAFVLPETKLTRAVSATVQDLLERRDEAELEALEDDQD